MALRTIQAPGIQVNEIDRSLYDQYLDTGYPNAPVCFIAGFAEKGDDYTITGIASREDFEEKYGYPLTEAEKYFYNGAIDVLKNGGKLVTAKLPYDNNSKDKYTYVDYYIDPTPHEILTKYQITGKWNTIQDIRKVLDLTIKTILLMQESGELCSQIFPLELTVNIETVPDMRDAINTIITSKEFENISAHFSLLDSEKETTLEDSFYFEGNVDTFIYNCIEHGKLYSIDSTEEDQLVTIDKEVLSALFNAIIAEITTANGIEFEYKKLYRTTTNANDDVPLYQKLNANDITTVFVTLNGIMCTQPVDNKHVTTAGVAIDDLYNVYLRWSLYTIAGRQFADNLRNVHMHAFTVNVATLRSNLQYIVDSINSMHPYIDLMLNDSEITSYCQILPDIDAKTGMAKSGMITMDLLDDYLTNNYTSLRNKIRIVDITRNQYESTPFKTVKSTYVDKTQIGSLSSYVEYTNDCLGIVPVIVTAANALYFLNLLQDASSRDYNVIANFNSTMTTNKNVVVEINKNVIYDNLYIDFKNGKADSPQKETLSKMVADCFPLIERENYLHFDKEYFKKIGVVVLSAFIDNANNKKLNFKVLESFVGSLDRAENSIDNNSDIFIDHIVNNNSKYIRFFSNANIKTVKETAIVTINNLTATSLGFYKLDCIKNIDTQTSILTPLKMVLENMVDTRGWQIDLVLDAGLTNIGQYLQGVNSHYSSLLNLNDRPYFWWAIANIYDNFCKFTRKDCMFLLDAPRPFCLEGELKIVRRTKPTNTIANSIIPKLKYLTGINSSYTAGYCNWFKYVDEFSGDVFWCPPSIKAALVYIYTDVYYHKWNAPAGMNRGRVTNVLDCAFSPTNDEAGRLYTQCWNYAVNYPHDGIVIEGQRTFLRKATALDRVNVRKLMLHLEKSVVNIAKYFLYEGHTSYLRDRFVNAITPIFEDAINGYGISDYIIKCDEENNPTIAIERNELHCSIAVKPVKAVEFIVLNFIVTNLSANVLEEVAKA